MLARERLRAQATDAATPVRQQAREKLGGRRKTNPAAMKHYLVVLEEIESLSGARAVGLAGDVARVVAHDVALARARVAKADADAASEQDQRAADGRRGEAAKWSAVLGKLEGVERSLAAALA